jgi:lysophospholipase L1-like esterase
MTTNAGSPTVGFRAKLLAAVLSLVVGLGVAEIGARMFYPRPPALGREPQLRYRPDPELGFVHLSSQSGYLDDGLATINDLGLRGTRPQLPKPSGEMRVLAIGDSTTFGWGVGDDETYTDLLEKKIAAAAPQRRVRVINGGVVSYDLRQSARRLEQLAPVLHPDIVIVGVLWNDLPYEDVSPDGNAQPGRSSSPRIAAASTQTFRMANQPTGLAALVRRSRLAFAIRHAWLAAIAPTAAATNQVRWEMAILNGVQTPAIDNAWNDLGRTFSDIQAMADRIGFAVGVIVMPVRAQVDQSYPNAAYQTRVRALAEARGFFVIDPLGRFTASPDRAELFIPYDRMHFTRAGNALLADAAYDALRARPEFAHAPLSHGATQ